MDNTTFQRIKDLIMQHQTIGVVVKPNPSLDEMAAGLGMFLTLKQMGKQAAIACPTDPVVGVSNLVGIDKVQKTFSAEGNGELVVSFPYKEGEIEKVSYNLDNEKSVLNIVVKAGQNGLSFNNNDVKFQRSAAGVAPTLVFAIGTPDLAMVNTIVPATQGITIVNIDNKADNKQYGDVVVTGTKFSSVSEQVADFVTLLEPQIELDVDTAQNLFNGVSFATNDFTAPQTSYLAFEMAGILMKKGAKRGTKPAATVPAGQPVSQFFPPMSNSPLNQPMQQPVQPMMPQQPIMQQPQVFQPISQPVMQQQPQPFTQPVMNQPVQPIQQSAQQPQEAPADWLTPKVYKGSTIL